jgi:Flp pilus assembly protein TadG
MIKRWRHFAKDTAGASMIEAVFVLPLLLGVMLAIFQFGWLFGAFVSLTNAAAAGAQTFANCGGFPPASGTPCASPLTAATDAAEGAAGFLKAADLTVTASVSGTECTSNSACSTALQSAAQNTPATVTAGYPCSILLLIPQSALALLGLTPRPWGFCPGSTFTVASTEFVP